MNRFVLKDKQGRYVAHDREAQTDKTTTDLEKAARFNHEIASRLGTYYYKKEMTAVPFDTEVLVYFPHVAYHASDEYDAKKYVRKIHLGEADGQFSQAIAVKVQGLWFVYARREAVAA